ncbi:FAD-dependent monooxygenase [Antrihabitans sp. YC2-6]|uniref:FAD-dependent monooxygenase n=1 Tax=Antrihabitans sp. YC2-6 TaxID=2799498 RepID=UPI0018F3C91B|nr:FAD-dependent monooxygenase [Antrihabitans sp. YC2-6]MBJ8348249.1 FAD-dependent monooxygenase [Antrihabitans sp. YC2-6]
MSRQVEVVGGGPAGLYVARLLKLAEPELRVVVHERLGSDAETFGFGVGLTEATMRNLANADPETADQIRHASFAGHTLDFRRAHDNITLHGARNLAIGRATLLRILEDAATRVGVEIRTGAKADVTTTAGADVIIAADGVRSSTRRKLSADLGVGEILGRSRFVWCGADFAVDSAFFAAAEAPQGLFVAHAYPYADDRSTFLIEVDEDTWVSANLGGLDAVVPAGETDHASVEILNRVFEDALHGRPLLTNRTRWGRFTTLTLDRWSVGNTVLIGDAAHTAHYTLGSGTKLALEDSIALAEALRGESSVAAAFAAYEQARREPVERFKRLASRSQAWWDSYRVRADRPIGELALSYMTRAGNLGIADYARDQLEHVRTALSWLGDNVPIDPSMLDDWVLSRPLTSLNLPAREVDSHTLDRTCAHESIEWNSSRVWDELADAALHAARQNLSIPLLVTGDNDLESIGARIDLAERIRLQTGRVVGVLLPAAARAQAAAAVGAGRADFIVRG